MSVLLREAIGGSIRRARTERNRTLRDVSHAARVSLGYLSEIERGRKEPSSELLAAICDALALSLPDLLDEVADSMRPTSVHPVQSVAARRMALLDPALRRAVEEALGSVTEDLDAGDLDAGDLDAGDADAGDADAAATGGDEAAKVPDDAPTACLATPGASTVDDGDRETLDADARDERDADEAPRVVEVGASDGTRPTAGSVVLVGVVPLGSDGSRVRVAA